ncbi:MAG: hypothetical protein ACRDQ5_28590 [Sciscionella sp.]
MDTLDRVGLPTRIGDLLLTLAGRLDDDALIEAREFLAIAEMGRAVELTLGCLAAGSIPVTDAEHAELSCLAHRLLLDDRLLDLLVVHDHASVRHQFTSGCRDDPAPEEGVLDALDHVLRVLPDIRGLWCVWRTTMAGAVPGLVPQRVVLIEVGPAGFAPSTAYRAACALRAADIRGVVEVLRSSGNRPPYHEEALAAARSVPLGGLLSTSTAEPGRPSGTAAAVFGAAGPPNASNRSVSTSGSSGSEGYSGSRHASEAQRTGSSGASATEPESRAWTSRAWTLAPEPPAPEPPPVAAEPEPEPAPAEPARTSVADEPMSSTSRTDGSASPSVAPATSTGFTPPAESPASASAPEPTVTAAPTSAGWPVRHPEDEQQTDSVADTGSTSEPPVTIDRDHPSAEDDPTTGRPVRPPMQIPGEMGLNQRELGLLRQLHEELSRREQSDRESDGKGPGGSTVDGAAQPPVTQAEQGFGGWMTDTEPQWPRVNNINGSQPYSDSAG